MVKFAPVISSAAVARAAQVNNQRTRATRTNCDLSSGKSGTRGRVRLPSLYPAISLKSLHSRSSNAESDGDQSTATRLNRGQSSQSLDITEQNLDRDGTSVLRELQDRNGGASPRVKSTSLVVGAAGILRAATAFAVDNTTAETTVQQAEQQIEEPECEVNNFRIWIS